MTPVRFLIILAVVVLVLFSVSLAVRSKTGDPKANSPTNSWVSRFNQRLAERQRVDPEKDFSSTFRTGRQLLIPKLVTQCTVTISSTDRSVRKAALSLKATDPLKLEYIPSPADAEAVPLKIDQFKPGQSIKLVFQKNGGRLTLTRLGVSGDAVLTID